jgi:hypothetical protein
METMHSNEMSLDANAAGIGKLFACGLCNVNFFERAPLLQHRREEHGQHVTEFRQVAQAHRRALKLFRLDFPDEIISVQEALFYANPHVLLELEKQSAQCSYYKASLNISVEFIKMDSSNEPEQSIVAQFRCNAMTVLFMRDMVEDLTNAYAHIDAGVLEFINRGSGWVVNDIICMNLEVAECRPIAGSCFNAHTISYNQKAGYVIDTDGVITRGLDEQGGTIRVNTPEQVCI